MVYLTNAIYHERCYYENPHKFHFHLKKSFGNFLKIRLLKFRKYFKLYRLL